MKLLNVIIEVLQERNWEYSRNTVHNTLEFEYYGKNATWQVQIQTIENFYQGLIYSYYPLKCDAHLMKDVGMLLHKINYGLVNGNLELDELTRTIRYKTSLDFSSSEIIYSQIESALDSNVSNADQYFSELTIFFATGK